MCCLVLYTCVGTPVHLSFSKETCLDLSRLSGMPGRPCSCHQGRNAKQNHSYASYKKMTSGEAMPVGVRTGHGDRQVISVVLVLCLDHLSDFQEGCVSPALIPSGVLGCSDPTETSLP